MSAGRGAYRMLVALDVVHTAGGLWIGFCHVTSLPLIADGRVARPGSFNRRPCFPEMELGFSRVVFVVVRS